MCIMNVNNGLSLNFECKQTADNSYTILKSIMNVNSGLRPQSRPYSEADNDHGQIFYVLDYGTLCMLIIMLNITEK